MHESSESDPNSIISFEPIWYHFAVFNSWNYMFCFANHETARKYWSSSLYLENQYAIHFQVVTEKEYRNEIQSLSICQKNNNIYKMVTDWNPHAVLLFAFAYAFFCYAMRKSIFFWVETSSWSNACIAIAHIFSCGVIINSRPICCAIC